MRPRLLAFSLVMLTVFLAVVRSPEPARGCAPAPPPGGRVDVASETALVVWDAPARVQHFIRTASFSSTSADFGFLVPTPSRPDLAEASSDVFTELATLTAPRTVVQTKTAGLGCGANTRSFTAVGSALPDAVEVVEQKRVGDFDAAVLRADDAKALREWLLKNGYDARPALEGWLRFYVENQWFVTAFKVATGEPRGNPDAEKPRPPARPLAVNGSAVRMSFATDRPFFPYREPEDQRAGSGPTPSRLLRVYLLADSRFDGTLGDGSSAWPGRTVWANPLARPNVEAVAKAAKLPEKLGADLAGRDWWLTEFEDRANPRPGVDEVYFGPSPDPSPVERPPNVQYVYREWPIWLGLAAAAAVPVLAVVLLGLVIRRTFRRG